MRGVLYIAGLLLVADATAAPIVGGTSGTWSDGNSVTITGSGFGTKSQAAPFLFDDGSLTDMSLWDGAWPSTLGLYNPTQRTPGTTRPDGGVFPPAPHTHVSRYIGGAHAGNSGPQSGYNVMFWKTRSMSAGYPQYSYWTWYERFSDDWVHHSLDTNPADSNYDDRNLKDWDWSQGGSPYTMPQNWYWSWTTPGPENFPGCGEMACDNGACAGLKGHSDDGSTLTRETIYQCHNGSVPDGTDCTACAYTSPSSCCGAAQPGMTELCKQGGGGYQSNYGSGEPSINPFACIWHKIELEIKWATDSSGFVRAWVDGYQYTWYTGDTDNASWGTSRTESLGGFARDDNEPTNWRFYADVYHDRALSRAVLCDGSAYTNRGQCEPQPATSWAAGAITVTVNQGKFANGSTAYLYVVDSTGTANAAGSPVTIGGSGSGDTTPPANPKNLRVMP